MTGIVVASTNGLIGIEAAVDVVRQGGSALDAVIAGTRLVEANPDDHTVGYAGIPNLLGEIELDASVMEGRGLRTGAVAAVQGYQDVTDLARAVMEELPHALIAGDGARRLAAEIGLSSKDLMTPKVRDIWEQRLASNVNAPDDSWCYMGRVRELVWRMTSDA